MKKINKHLTILIHLFFWSGFLLLFYFQNKDTTIIEYAKLMSILIIASIAVYSNLYVLFPTYFNKKKFTTYTILLTLLIIITALLTTYLFSTQKINIFYAFLQNIVNIFFFIVITSGLKFFRDNNRNQLQIKELENVQLNTELSLLKSQINPHFLFNSLNNLYGLILHNKNQVAAKNILSLSELMRYVLESSNQKEVVLHEEIRFINNYLDLERIRLPNRIDIRFDVSLSSDTIEISPLLFIPMIENAFKHGIDHHTQKAFLHFSLSVQGNELFFEAKNSLSDITIREEHVSGKGLINLQKRLDILYPNKHSLSIEKDKKTYAIILILDL